MSAVNTRPTTTQAIIETLAYLNGCESVEDEPVNEFLENVATFIEENKIDEKSEFEIKEALGSLDAKLKEGSPLSPTEQKTSNLIHSIMGAEKVPESEDDLEDVVLDHCTWIGAHLFARSFVETEALNGTASSKVIERLEQLFYGEEGDLRLSDYGYSKMISEAIVGMERGGREPPSKWDVQFEYIPEESTPGTYVFVLKETSNGPKSEIKFMYNTKDRAFKVVKRSKFEGKKEVVISRKEETYKIVDPDSGEAARADILEKLKDLDKLKGTTGRIDALCDACIEQLASLESPTIIDIDEIVQDFLADVEKSHDGELSTEQYQRFDDWYDDNHDNVWTKPVIEETASWK